MSGTAPLVSRLAIAQVAMSCFELDIEVPQLNKNYLNNFYLFFTYLQEYL
jgi:hypothetical protein